jgi:hypothetical protein
MIEQIPKEIYSESYFSEMKGKINAISDALVERDEKDKDSHLSAEFQRFRDGWATFLRGKYRGVDGKDYFDQYAMYYVLAGGTIGPQTDIRHEDFPKLPKDDSVAHFIEKMEEYYA